MPSPLKTPAAKGCLPAIFYPLLRRTIATPETSSNEYPFVVAGRLLTTAERNFFAALTTAIRGQGLFTAVKVRLADVIQVDPSAERFQSHFNRISAKHIDFVLCRADSTQPVLAIELDDSSHAGKKAKTRDAFLKNALEAANVPLLRVLTAGNYSVDELQRAILASIVN